MSVLRLELDVGNSSLKWRYMRGGQRIDGGRINGSSDEVLALLKSGPAMVYIASVGSAARERDLVDVLSRSGVPFTFARSQRQCAGVTNSYVDVGKMGVDRWLVMIAAYAECSAPCAVIDAGTALTVDIVDDAGVHLGGYIIAGVGLSAKALADHTGRVRFAGDEKVSLAPGVDTESCVHHGKWLAQLGAVNAALEQAELAVGGKLNVYITGGDAPALLTLAGARAEQWRYRDELVLDGLAAVMAAS